MRVGAEVEPALAVASVKAAVEPVTVPSVIFCAGELAAIFWLIWN